jgi:hypothetical protein
MRWVNNSGIAVHTVLESTLHIGHSGPLSPMEPELSLVSDTVTGSLGSGQRLLVVLVKWLGDRLGSDMT